MIIFLEICLKASSTWISLTSELISKWSLNSMKIPGVFCTYYPGICTSDASIEKDSNSLIE